MSSGSAGGGVDGNLVGTKRENFGGVVGGFNPARHAERNIDHFRYARDPAFVDYAAIAGRGNIVEHQFVCAFIGIAFCQRDDVANDLVVAELHAFHDRPSRTSGKGLSVLPALNRLRHRKFTFQQGPAHNHALYARSAQRGNIV